MTWNILTLSTQGIVATAVQGFFLSRIYRCKWRRSAALLELTVSSVSKGKYYVPWFLMFLVRFFTVYRRTSLTGYIIGSDFPVATGYVALLGALTVC